MFDEFMNDLIAMCDELVEEHGNDWNSMEPEEKKAWIMCCIERNAHATLENKEEQNADIAN